MAEGASADEDLGDLADLQGGHGSDFTASGFDGVLQGESVDDGGEHSGVMSGRLGHAELAGESAAEEVAAADDDADFDASVAALDDLSGDVVERLGVDA